MVYRAKRRTSGLLCDTWLFGSCLPTIPALPAAGANDVVLGCTDLREQARRTRSLVQNRLTSARQVPP